MAEKAAIIGAGGTGRGFLARLLKQDGASVTFLDKDQALIHKLREAGSYHILHGDKDYCVDDYKAFVLDSKEGIDALAEADWIFTSIGNEHLAELSDSLKKAVQQKQEGSLKIITCENGTCPKKNLLDALREANLENVMVTQGVIFCSSIPKDADTLDILSEDYEELPYDVDEELFELPFKHFPPTKHFSELLERKIYTYNCLSACIAYLGAYKGYVDYADAGNDEEILWLCRELLKGLNRVISEKYRISEEEQRVFSERALKKFSNRNISDTIQKNARAAIRKLSSDERILGPIEIMTAWGEDPEILYLVAAAALIYLEENEKMELEGRTYKEPLALFQALDAQISEAVFARIKEYYMQLKRKETIDEIVEKMKV